MISVVLIGTGNVSTKLQQVFSQSEEVHLSGVHGRKKRTGTILPSGLEIQEISQIDKNADIIMIATADDAIAYVKMELGNPNALVVHTAGSVPLEALAPIKRRGVFYPLQTLSADLEVDFTALPLCLECSQEKDRKLLQQLAESISTSVHWISSSERERLHLAAVFTNNFVNHMILQAEKICEEYDLPKELLHPLLDETVVKAKKQGAYKAQTGPAVRGDLSVIAKHIELLQDAARQKLYKTITASIQNEYESQL